MKITLKFEIDNVSKWHCIEKTLKEGCCPHLATRILGTIWRCSLFGVDLLDDANGRVLRSGRCLDLESSDET